MSQQGVWRRWGFRAERAAWLPDRSSRPGRQRPHECQPRIHRPGRPTVLPVRPNAGRTGSGAHRWPDADSVPDPAAARDPWLTARGVQSADRTPIRADRYQRSRSRKLVHRDVRKLEPVPTVAAGGPSASGDAVQTALPRARPANHLNRHGTDPSSADDPPAFRSPTPRPAAPRGMAIRGLPRVRAAGVQRPINFAAIRATHSGELKGTARCANSVGEPTCRSTGMQECRSVGMQGMPRLADMRGLTCKRPDRQLEATQRSQGQAQEFGTPRVHPGELEGSELRDNRQSRSTSPESATPHRYEVGCSRGVGAISINVHIEAHVEAHKSTMTPKTYDQTPPPTLRNTVAHPWDSGRLTTNCARRGHRPCHIARGTARVRGLCGGLVAWSKAWHSNLRGCLPRGAPTTTHRTQNMLAFLRKTVEGRQLHHTANSKTNGRLRQDPLDVHSIRGVACSAEAAPDGFIKGGIWGCLNPQDVPRRTLQPPSKVVGADCGLAAGLVGPAKCRTKWTATACFRCHGWNDMIECRTISRAGSVAWGAQQIEMDTFPRETQAY